MLAWQVCLVCTQVQYNFTNSVVRRESAAALPDRELESASQPDISQEPEPRPATLSQRARLEELISASTSSAEKRELLANSETVFSGRCSPTEVRCLLATLEEGDLRGLRDVLLDRLTTAIPATAGRPLRNRQSGNMSALADDCWELGYSAVQGQLSRRADTNVLKPAGRTPLPPPSSVSESPPGLVSAATVEASLRSVIDTQLRMDCELEDLRRRAASADTLRARLQRLEEQTSELQLACAARDAKIAQLENLLGSVLDQQSASRPRGGDSASIRDNQARAPTNSSCGANSESQAEIRSAVAEDIATAIDARALGKAIAVAIHRRAGDSDSESDYDVSERPDGSRGVGAPGSTARRRSEPTVHSSIPPPSARDRCFGRPEIAPPPVATAVDSRPLAEYDAVAGAGPASDLVLTATVAPKSATCKYIVGGFRPDAPDSAVHDLVQSVAGVLYDFRRLPPDGPSAPASAYMFEIAESFSAAVMDLGRWPTGLSVRPKANNRGRRRGRFRAANLQPYREQHTAVKTSELSRSRPCPPAPPPADPRAQGGLGPTTGYLHEHGEWITAMRRGRAQRHNDSAASGYRYPRDGDWRWCGGARQPPTRR